MIQEIGIMLHRNRPRICDESPFKAPGFDYAHNILATTSLRRLESSKVRSIDSLDVVIEMARLGRGTRTMPKRGEEFTSEGLRDSLRRYLARRAKPRAPRPPGSPVAENLALVGDLVGLDDSDRAVFQFLLALRDRGDVKELMETFGSLPLSGSAALISAATSVSGDAVLRALGRGGRLISSGIVAVRNGIHEFEEKIGLKCGVFDAMLEPDLDEVKLLNRFLPEAAPATLDWGDFTHLREEVGIARDLLNGAVENRRHGINILFYGESGTGKTELSRLLAREIGAPLYVAGRADEDGESANPRERLSSLLLGQRLIQNGRVLLLFDELEDLFRSDWQDRSFGPSRRSASMSKQWFNDLLENNSIPTIWITNTTEGVDPAFLRRFCYAIEFRPLGPRQRARVLARHLGGGSVLTAGEVATIAERYSVSPGLLGSAVAAAKLLSPDGRPDRSAIERVLAPMEKLVTGTESSHRPVFDASSYRLDGLNSPANLEGIVEQLSEWKPGSREGISLCLYGPPGTGKSEYVKYLAHRMGRPILYRRVSDIMNCYVGQTEKNIARAFREAEENDSVLLFDEADSFLRDRGKAMRSWEVTFVNEFLQQLESFRGIVACTTNLWRDLDEASLRRFVFKIEFRYLRADQAMSLFHSTFARDLVAPLTESDKSSIRAALSRVANLAPGDFAAVTRQVRSMKRSPSAIELLELLEAEARAKPGGCTAMGF